MDSRWIDRDRTVLVITTACGTGEHDKCTPEWRGGACGCICHLRNDGRT